MRSKREQASRDVGIITDVERHAIEERLGFDTESLSAWGHVVRTYLFAQPADRRAPILAYALSVFPYVRAVGADRFAMVPVTEDGITRCLRAHEPALLEVIADALRGGWAVCAFADRILAFLASLTEEEQTVLLARVFWKYPVAPYALQMGAHVHGKSSSHPMVSAADIAARAPELRARVIELRNILEHLPCAPSWEDAMREFLVKFGRIEDPDVRAMVLAHCVGELVGRVVVSTERNTPNVVAIAPPPEVVSALLEKIRSLAFGAGERDRRESDADPEEISDDFLRRKPKAEA